MLKPRPLPPVHKNQLFLPIHSIGFFTGEDPTPSLFRNHEITKKRLKPQRAGVFAPSNPLPQDPPQDDLTDKEVTSSITSSIHIRGRASVIDPADVALNMEETPRKSPTKEEQEEEVHLTSFLTEDPTSSRSYDGRSSTFSPLLECSKYNVIGEPRFRKKRTKRKEWTLPQLEKAPQQQQQQQQQQQAANSPRHLKTTNAIDLHSIYSSHSKLHQVPAEAKREDTVILPPLEIGRRREEAEASVDANNLAEKRLVLHSQRHQNLYRRLIRDHVAFPTAYRPYFRFKHRQQKFVRSVFTREDVWESHPQPVRCARCVHQSTATRHYCDVLGKRFCRFCSEMTDRHFSGAYEGNRLLVPSPLRSPTVVLEREPSFIGVRKVVITKTTRKEGQGQGQGRDLAAAGTDS